MVERKVVLFLLLFSLPVYASPCIDFWGDGCGVQEKKEQKKKRPTKREILEKLYEESLKWTPDNLSPLEKYVSLHPEDKEALEMLKKYLAVRQVRACYLERGLSGRDTSYCKQLEREWERWGREKAETSDRSTNVSADISEVRFLFFYNERCSVCRKVLPTVRKVLGNRVEMIPASPVTGELFEKWKVFNVPTLIAVRGKKALRLTGEFDEKTLQEFLKIVSEKLPVAAAKLLPDEENSSLGVSTLQDKR